jgi:Domain of unknown function (DUF4351)
MSQFPHDRLNKNLFELCLSDFGEVSLQRSVQSETKFIDIYFTPQVSIPAKAGLGLLAQCINQNHVAFEPYRNPVEIDDIQACIIKILEVQQELNRSDSQPIHQAFMWIVTPTLAKPKLEKFGATCDEVIWGKGVYIATAGLQLGIIVVHQLSVVPETLWFRLMGRGKVQQRAMTEIAALPEDHVYRNNALNLLLSYTIELEARKDTEPEERDLIMQLSPLLLERLEAAEQRGKLQGNKDLVLRQLSKQMRVEVPTNLADRIKALSVEQIEALGEALLDFHGVEDLVVWLAEK